jgi:transposase
MTHDPTTPTPLTGSRRRPDESRRLPHPARDEIAVRFQAETQEVPKKYRSGRSVYSQSRTWDLDGLWERIFTALIVQVDAGEDLAWTLPTDSTSVWGHEHAAVTREEPSA